ncbi:hypothetical protein [Kitasatospora sp. NPDC090091]|uniref:hypothetical protein n=1 Tax=Kitasatospora sp. NPDC090091 TaxID=3364081 RepID=UPI0037F69576
MPSTAPAPVAVHAIAAELATPVPTVARMVSVLCLMYGRAAVVHTPAPGNRATLLHPDAAARVAEMAAVAGTVEGDLRLVAEVLAARGVWTGDHAFGADSELGPVDPAAAAWIATHGHLPAVFTTRMPGAAETAAEMLLTDPATLLLVEFVAANADSDLPDEAPLERIAEWAGRVPEGEVVGRIGRLARPGTVLAA